jgi:isopentenyldiphosphate isomerase
MASIPIVDKEDNVIGHKERSELSPTDIYRSTGLWITNAAGNVLLARRSHTKRTNPGIWSVAVNGGVEDGETYESNILKEAQEELGLKNIEPILGKKELILEPGHFRFLQWFFLEKDIPIQSMQIDSCEVAGVRWFTPIVLRQEILRHPDEFNGRLVAWANSGARRPHPYSTNDKH